MVFDLDDLLELVLLEGEGALLCFLLLDGEDGPEEEGVVAVSEGVEVGQEAAAHEAGVSEQGQQVVPVVVVELEPLLLGVRGEAVHVVLPAGYQSHHVHRDLAVVLQVLGKDLHLGGAQVGLLPVQPVEGRVAVDSVLPLLHFAGGLHLSLPQGVEVLMDILRPKFANRAGQLVEGGLSRPDGPVDGEVDVLLVPDELVLVPDQLAHAANVATHQLPLDKVTMEHFYLATLPQRLQLVQSSIRL